MAPYRIQLRGPWEYVLIARAEGDDGVQFAWDRPASPAAGQVKMPAEWRSFLGDFRGRVRFDRNFHQPTNLDPGERVFIVFGGVGGSGDVLLNGQVIGAVQTTEAPQRFDITSLLRGDNLLQVQLDFSGVAAMDCPGGLYAPVALEIETVA